MTNQLWGTFVEDLNWTGVQSIQSIQSHSHFSLQLSNTFCEFCTRFKHARRHTNPKWFCVWRSIWCCWSTTKHFQPGSMLLAPYLTFPASSAAAESTPQKIKREFVVTEARQNLHRRDHGVRNIPGAEPDSCSRISPADLIVPPRGPEHVSLKPDWRSVAGLQREEELAGLIPASGRWCP